MNRSCQRHTTDFAAAGAALDGVGAQPVCGQQNDAGPPACFCGLFGSHHRLKQSTVGGCHIDDDPFAHAQTRTTRASRESSAATRSSDACTSGSPRNRRKVGSPPLLRPCAESRQMTELAADTVVRWRSRGQPFGCEQPKIPVVHCSAALLCTRAGARRDTTTSEPSRSAAGPLNRWGGGYATALVRVRASTPCAVRGAGRNDRNFRQLASKGAVLATAIERLCLPPVRSLPRLSRKVSREVVSRPSSISWRTASACNLTSESR